MIRCIVVHETSRQNKNGLSINNIFPFTHELFWSQIILICKPKVSDAFEKIFVISIIFDKCGNKDKRKFKEEVPIKMLKILDLISNIDEYWKSI